MFGIVIQHVVGQSAYIRHGADFLTNWCVCGFVFVSGYFGIKFKPSKFISLVALGVFCAVVSNMAYGKPPLVAVKAIRYYWYLWAYLFLMLLAPLINSAFEKCDRKAIVTMVLPIVFLIYGWSFAGGVPVVRDWMPICNYLGGCNGVSLVGLYVFTLAYKKLGLKKYCTFRNSLIVLPACILLMLVGFWSFAWIPSFIVTCIAFEYVKKLNLPIWLGKISIFIAPSMFSVYLLHICNCTHLMASFERYCVEKVGMSLCIMFSVTAVLTFAVCLMVDLVRRFALIPVRPVMGKVMCKIDAAYVNAIDFIEQKLVADR
jgi:surface polysaccharide O-acyltransferase-like enzyme